MHETFTREKHLLTKVKYLLKTINPNTQDEVDAMYVVQLFIDKHYDI